MKLTSEEGQQIVYDDHADWESLENTKEVDEGGRWTTGYTQVFKHKPTGEHYQLSWASGATEMQEEQPFEYSEPEPVLMVEKTIEVKQWVPAT